MKVMVVGGGGREHALVWKLLQSPRVSEVYVAPGNAGTGKVAHNLNISPTNLAALAEAAEQHNIDLTVVGPEAPLALGMVDLFQRRGWAIFGPTQAATLIESSKVFAKELMRRHGIPCAGGKSFTSLAEAREYLRSQELPVVIKADGLAAGKGAIVATSREQASQALVDIMERRVFGVAGDKVIIEECLQGREVSLLALTDGKTVLPLVPACDYKRVYDSDQGPNTGGMGSYSPPGFFTEKETGLVTRTILEPVVRAMEKEGKPYQGVLYAGLMLTAEGPQVLEFNARFGDPETQVILPRLQGDLLEAFLAVVNGTLDRVKLEWSEGACVGVVVASGGYPGSYHTGFPIRGLERLDKDILVFQAGTRTGAGGEIYTDGGRVLTVVATGENMLEARARVYFNVPCIRFPDCHYRRDIALREIECSQDSSIQKTR